MSAIDIAVIAAVAVLFSAALAYAVYRKIKGKGCCDCADCDCGNCGGRDSCSHGNCGTAEKHACPHCSGDAEKIE